MEERGQLLDATISFLGWPRVSDISMHSWNSGWTSNKELIGCFGSVEPLPVARALNWNVSAFYCNYIKILGTKAETTMDGQCCLKRSLRFRWDLALCPFAEVAHNVFFRKTRARVKIFQVSGFIVFTFDGKTVLALC